LQAFGLKKQCLLLIIKYRQITSSLFPDMNLHPEIKKEMETCNFLLEHNLPVEKEMLF